MSSALLCSLRNTLQTLPHTHTHTHTITSEISEQNHKAKVQLQWSRTRLQPQRPKPQPQSDTVKATYSNNILPVFHKLCPSILSVTIKSTLYAYK